MLKVVSFLTLVHGIGALGVDRLYNISVYTSLIYAKQNTSIRFTAISSSFTLGQSWPTEDITIELFSHGPAKPQAGSRVEYQCKVRGSQQVFYQWFKDGQELQGQNMSTLTLDPLRMQDFGFYKCQVRIGSICVASKVVELNVTPARGKSKLIYHFPKVVLNI